MEVPESEPDENKTPSKRARDETPLAGSISRRTRSKRELSADSSKKGRSKSPVTVLTDSLVKGISPAPIAPAIEVVGPSSVISIGGTIFPMSLDAKVKKYRRKTTAHKTKAVESDIGSSSNEVNVLSLSFFLFFFFTSILVLIFSFCIVSCPISLVTVRGHSRKSTVVILRTQLQILITFCYSPSYHLMFLLILMAFLSQVMLLIP